MKFLPTLLLLLASVSFAGANVRVVERRDPGAVYVYAQNAGGTRKTVTFKLTGLTNGSTDWPKQSVKVCMGGDSALVAVLYQTAGSPALTYTYDLQASDETPAKPVEKPVDPNAPTTVTLPSGGMRTFPTPQAKPTAPASEADLVYRLPYKSGKTYRVTQGYGGIRSHRDSFSLDFDMRVGTEVCAAMDGYVELIENATNGYSAEGGNVVLLAHPNGTQTLYGHLKKDGIKVTRGQAVKAGEVIALSGNTGKSTGPHLHFAVLRRGPAVEGEEIGKEGSIRTRFVTTKSDSATLFPGNGYTAP